MDRVRGALLIPIALVLLAFSSCPPPGESGATLSLSFAVPGFPASPAIRPGAKALSPNAAMVRISVEGPDFAAMSRDFDVTPGVTTTCTLPGVPIGPARRITVEAFLADRTTRISSNTVTRDVFSGSVSIPLVLQMPMELGTTATATATDISGGSDLLAGGFKLEAGQTKFAEILIAPGAVGGPLQFIAGNGEDVWMCVYEKAPDGSWKTLTPIASDPTSGWCLIDAVEGATYEVCLAAPATEGYAVLPLAARKAYFASEVGGGKGEGPATPAPSLQYLLGTYLTSVTDSFSVFVSRGTWSGAAYSIEDNVMVYGGFEPGTWKRDPASYKTSLSVSSGLYVFSFAGNGGLHGIDGCEVIAPAASGLNTSAINHSGGTGRFLVSDCVVKGGTATSNFEGLLSAIDGNSMIGVRCIVKDCSITGGNLSGLLSDMSSAGIALSGALSILLERNAISGGTASGGSSNTMSGAILTLNTGESAVIRDNIIDAGTAVGIGGVLTGILVNGPGDSTTTLECYRNAVHGGYLKNSGSGMATLTGISVGLGPSLGGRDSVTIMNNLVSGGRVELASMAMTQLRGIDLIDTSAAVYYNTIDAGAVTGPAPNSDRWRKVFCICTENPNQSGTSVQAAYNVLFSTYAPLLAYNYDIVAGIGKGPFTAIDGCVGNAFELDGFNVLHDGTEYPDISKDPYLLNLAGSVRASFALKAYSPSYTSTAGMVGDAWSFTSDSVPSLRVGSELSKKVNYLRDFLGRLRTASTTMFLGAIDLR